MNLNEDATLTLKANTRDFANELAQLDTRAKDLKKTLKEIETTGTGKGSEEWKKYKAELVGVNTELAKTKKEVDLTKLTFGQLSNLVNQLNRDLKGLVPGTDAFNAALKRLDAAKATLADVDKQVKGINKESDELGAPTKWQKVSNGIGMVGKAFQAIIALQIVGYIIDIGKSIFETTAKFEKYEKVLTTAFGGNVKLAKESLSALKALGAQTAFSVDELTEGYVKLVNRGIRPSKSEMVALTDLAASQGKTFDQLVEGLLDAATGEFERLKGFGTRASKAGDEVAFKFKNASLVIKNTGEGFDVLDKATGKVVNTFKDQEDATLGVLTALGKMDGVAGQNADMMETLSGRSSNLGDSFDALKVELGTGLRPVFVAILNLISGSIPVLGFLGKALGTVLLTAKFGVEMLVDILKNAGMAIFELGKAAYELAKGNFDGAAKAWESVKTYSKSILTSVNDDAKLTNKQIDAIWTNPNAGVAAEFAGKDQGKKFQGGISDEQKKAIKEREAEQEKARKKAIADHQKHLEDVQKANAKALEDLAKLETENHVASIKDEMQREFVKLMAVRDQKAEEILKTLASEELKNQQIAQLDKKLQEDIDRVAGEFAEKKRKKAEEEEKKRLETQKSIIEQERQAENALLDWKELMATGNAKKLAAIHQERVQTNYTATITKLDAEEAAEKAKASREITDKDQLDQALTAIEGRYHNERILVHGKTAAEIEKIEKDLQEKKKAAWGNASNAFSALLKGDLNSFVEHASKIYEGEKRGWQKKLEGEMATYEAVAQMATAAVQFLNQLAQKKAEKAIAEARRERDEKVAILNDALEKEKAGVEQTTEKIQQTKEQASDKIKSIKEAEEVKIRDLEKLYSDMSNSESKADLSAEITRTNEESTAKITAANKTKTEAISAAKEEKTEKINAAEATRDAEIASINKRADLDSATRKKMIAESKARAEGEIKQATDEADKKIKLSNEEAEAKTKDAKEEAAAKIKLMKELQTADKDRAKELIANAKEEADKKVKLAEEEKAAKLKLLEAEKATRIQNKKDLERQIAEEDAKAKRIEAAAKLKAWQAQQKADIASALITGALATLKALASAFWPANLVFAAMSAVMTGVQVAMIKRQPQPQFEQGGFIPQGGRHASTYGKGGIGLIDRQSGRDVGEMEGGEAIISREQTQANLPLIRRMFANARTPGRRSQAVTDNRDALGRPAGFRDGGLFEPAVWSRDMFRYGGIPTRPKPPRYEDGGYSETSGDDGGGGMNIGEARAASDEAKKQGLEQLKLLGEIRDGVVKSATDTQSALKTMETNLRQTIQTGNDSQRMASAAQAQAVTGAINQQTTAIRAGLTEVRDTTKASVDGLTRTIVVAFNQSQGRKAQDSDALIQEMRTQTTRLGLGLQLILQDSTNKTVGAINSAKLTNQLVVANAALQTSNGLAKLSADMKRETDELTLVTKTGLANLLNQSKDDFSVLADRIEESIDTGADRTEVAIKAASLTNQLALSSLALKTVSSLTNLSVATVKSLSNLEKATVASLDDAATREELALVMLTDEVTTALAILNRDTTKNLNGLGNLTDAALKRLADRTTGSIDSLSVEVRSLKGSINETTGAVRENTGATRGVEGAVWGSNQSGRLDALIGAISTFGGK